MIEVVGVMLLGVQASGVWGCRVFHPTLPIFVQHPTDIKSRGGWLHPEKLHA